MLENTRHELIVAACHPAGAEALRRLAAQDRLTIVPLDTASLESIRTFAEVVKGESAIRKIAALGLNTGMQPSNTVRFPADGIEESFAAN